MQRRSKNTNKKAPTKLEKRLIPKSELETEISSTNAFSTLYSCGVVEFHSSKLFIETQPKDQQSLFILKSEECCQLCDFSNKSPDRRSKETKTQLLKQLVSAFNIPHLVHTIQPIALKSFFQMLSINLFRPFPIIKKNNILYLKESYKDDAWPHISLAYQCLTASFNCPLSISELSLTFIYKLVGNSISPDERDRKSTRLNSSHTATA